jgi:hypothetical protein
MNYAKLIFDSLFCIILLVIMIVAISSIFPQLGLGFLPKSTQKDCTLPPLTKGKKIAAFILYAFCGIAFVAYLFHMIIAAYGAEKTSYWIIFLHYFIVINVVHLFDIIILDWLMIYKITPKFLYRLFPGTENSLGYKEYGFNTREHIKNFIGTIVGGLALSGISFEILNWLIW